MRPSALIMPIILLAAATGAYLSGTRSASACFSVLPTGSYGCGGCTPTLCGPCSGGQCQQSRVRCNNGHYCVDSSTGFHGCQPVTKACFDYLTCVTEQGGPCDGSNACKGGTVYSSSSTTFTDIVGTGGSDCGPM